MTEITPSDTANPVPEELRKACATFEETRSTEHFNYFRRLAIAWVRSLLSRSAPPDSVSQPAECPRCGSDKPHLHPAVQFEGEVETCTDDFHLTPTPQNKPEYIERVLEKRRQQAPPEPVPSAESERKWRLHENSARQIFEGERHVATFPLIADAERAVEAVNAVPALRAEVERLDRECEQTAIGAQEAAKAGFAEQARADTLAARVETMRVALEPFKQLADEIDEIAGDTPRSAWAMRTTWPDLVRARAAYIGVPHAE